jgi:hypothetical protein
MIGSVPRLPVLMFVNAEPELVPGVSLRGFFLKLPASPPVDFRMIVLGFAGVGVRYPPLGIGILPFDALFEWSLLML